MPASSAPASPAPSRVSWPRRTTSWCGSEATRPKFPRRARRARIFFYSCPSCSSWIKKKRTSWLQSRRGAMEWEGREESENVDDRRSRGVKTGLAVGGGGIIILIVAYFLGVDPQKLAQFFPQDQ